MSFCQHGQVGVFSQVCIVSAGDAAEQADAVICAFNGGMFGGQAVAEALFGELCYIVRRKAG